ncbi:MAG: hypothetical protein Q9225_003450 [Loekoesia sp. 1 TL-2023]
MAHQRDELKDTWIASKAVIFMGTPHRGSRYADLGQILGTIADVALPYDETEKMCASLLNTIDIADYQAKIDSRVEGTLEWVLQKPQYYEWTSAPNTRLLWDVGKTVLASFIWRYLEERYSRSLVCRFFCDDKYEDFRDPCAMLRSLIFQIVNKRRRLWRLVKKASDAGGYRIFSQFAALWNLFVQLVRAETKYTTIIIIDAFDEFEREAQYRIAACLVELLSLGSTTLVKFLITSRPKIEGDLEFRASSARSLRLPLEDSDGEIDNDIRAVVHHRLERMERRATCPSNIRKMLENLLLARAGKTFLWIKLVLPVLEKRHLLGLSEAEVRGLVDAFPITLAALYKHLLTSIHEDDQDTAAKVLRLLVVCDRPLTGVEIGIMLTITPKHESISSLTPENLSFGQESIQSLLGPLIRVHDSRIELIHQSLKDYLIDLARSTQDSFATKFGVIRDRDKLLAFRACSMYLSLKELQQEIRLTLDTLDDSDSEAAEMTSISAASLFEPDIFNKPLSNEGFADGESTWAGVNTKYPLFDYAALHWAVDFPICAQTATAQDRNTALSLCQTHTAQLTNWFHYFWYKEHYYEPIPKVIDTLMVISYFGHLANLRHLLKTGESVDSESLSRALYWAAKQGQAACVTLLLQQPGCDAQSLATSNQVPLAAAAESGHLDCVSALLDHAHVNVNAQDNLGRTALSLAVGNNHADVVTRLLAYQGVDMNLQDHARNTPLHFAIGIASESLVAQLLGDKRAEIGRLDKRGRSILTWAAVLGDEQSASLIIHCRSIPIDQKDFAGRTPLSYAAQHGHLSIVQELVKTGQADPFGKDDQGRNAHSWAASQRNSDLLRYLLKRCPQGADVPDQNGWTPLAWTFDPPGYLDNFRLLLRQGHINLQQKDDVHGRTILSWTASYGYTQMAAELVKSPDVNLDARDFHGRTPLSEAAGSGNLEIMQLLIATEAVDMNSRDQSGQTPLSWAARGGHDEVVRLLITCKTVLVDSPNDSGETALDIAKKLDQKEVVSILERV